MNPTNIVNAWITSLVRMLLAVAGGYLIRKGWIDSSLWEATVGALIGGVITAFWALWEKYQVRKRVMTALELPSGTSVNTLEQVVKTS